MVFKNKMTFKNKCVVFTGSLQSMLGKNAIEYNESPALAVY